MKRLRHGTVRAVVAWLVCAAMLGACVGGNNAGQSSAQLSATLNASGATFPQAFYEEVIAAFKEQQPGVTINYAGGGSGKGRQELQYLVVDFAGSDGLVKPEERLSQILLK